MLLVMNEFFYLLRWQLLRMKPVLPLYLIVQTLLAAGIVIGFSYLIPNIDDTTALYLNDCWSTNYNLIIDWSCFSSARDC